MQKRLLLVATITFLTLFGLAACDKKGPAETAGEKLDQAAETMGDKIEEATDQASDSIEAAGDKVEDATD